MSTSESLRAAGSASTRRVTLGLTVSVALAALLLTPAARAATSRASFIQIENDVMCIACHEPLAVSQSPEADSERAYIRQLIAQGLTRRQVEKQLVAQYTAAILALPPAQGFNLLIYVLPPAMLAIGVLVLLVTIPKWRQRARSAASAPPPAGPRLDPEDTRRLAEDIARHA